MSGGAGLALPIHVAVIMDGNGRWARERRLPRLAGHRAGTENIRRVIEAFASFGVKHLTLYAFSTENWDRPDEEVNGLMDILGGVIRRETKALHERGARLRHLGRLDRLPPELQRAMSQAIELTMDNQGITVNVAFDYGGRAEILEAIRRVVRDGIPPEGIDEATLSSRLYTAGMPDPDLIVRTAGEMRLSNFLLWQSAYSEYYCTPVLWPDFDHEEVRKALMAYGQRRRRFGKVEA
ncbi:MAG: uppS [Dehalococcoidia bacterium]|nr:uppS [Dehalococcoidia bacterium]